MADMLMEVATYLQSQAVGTVGTDINNYLPDTPDSCHALYEHGDIGGPLTMAGNNHDWHRTTLQVITRAAAYDTGMAAAKAVYNALLPVYSLSLSGTHYVSIEPQHTPTAIEKDEMGRYLFSCNYEVIRRWS